MSELSMFSQSFNIGDVGLGESIDFGSLIHLVNLEHFAETELVVSFQCNEIFSVVSLSLGSIWDGRDHDCPVYHMNVPQCSKVFLFI